MLNRNKSEKLCSFFAMPKDFLAKRKLNTAPNQKPNIFLSGIEQDGISLEQLDILNVPVYRYATQITIHGVWPETNGHCLGYKQIIKNQNNSIGIRYNAIDGQKKKHLLDLCRYSKFNSWHNSTENSFSLSFKSIHKMRALKVFKHLKQYETLFVGGVTAFYDQYLTGRYYIVIDLNAIPESNMKVFEKKILKVTDKKIALINERKAKEQAQKDIENNIRDKKDEDLKKIAISQAIDTLIIAGLKSIIPNGSEFRGFIPTYDSEYTNGWKDRIFYPGYKLIEVKHKAFGRCYKIITHRNFEAIKNHQFDWTKKAHRFDKEIKTIYI